MQGLRRQTAALGVEADLQVLGGETPAVTPGHSATEVTVVVTGVITCSAIFSLREARGQLRWEAATSASTMSVCVQSRVRRLGWGAQGCRIQGGRTEEEEVEMLLRKRGLRGAQPPAPPHHLLLGWDRGQGCRRGAALLREGGRGMGQTIPGLPNTAHSPGKNPSQQDEQTPANKGRGGPPMTESWVEKGAKVSRISAHSVEKHLLPAGRETATGPQSILVAT